ncbi:hypothetical protein RRG08_006907 [Elysia crispata]|uniref:Uncharacterized protein n=1 Tax=Elysia crispata TaxID=231223 RepID=A0AAE1ED87_9GAST|nr:hypothetical protein RRG08_006907 [Elysia crispata]
MKSTAGLCKATTLTYISEDKQIVCFSVISVRASSSTPLCSRNKAWLADLQGTNLSCPALVHLSCSWHAFKGTSRWGMIGVDRLGNPLSYI